MSELPERCVPCHGGVEPLSGKRAAELVHRYVPAWTLDPPRIRRRLAFDDFPQTLAFLNRVAALAEEEQHHPDLHLTDWNRLEIVLWTHAIDGLSENDIVLARKIDLLERSSP